MNRLDKLKANRNFRRFNEFLIYLTVAIVVLMITGVILFSIYKDDSNIYHLIWTSVILNVAASIFLIKMLYEKVVSLYYNEDSELSLFEDGKNLHKISSHKLKKLLEIVVEKENYTTASKIRDELKNR